MGKFDELVKTLSLYSSPQRLALPDIPNDYIRLTHVMPDRSLKILSSGEPFIYEKYGLDGTTDAYSSNDSIEWLARTGDPLGIPRDGMQSNWSRNDFGNHMAIIDLPANAHKSIVKTYGAYSEPIPNAAILGFVDRQAMKFQPNPRYDRAVIDDYGLQATESIRRLLENRNKRFLHKAPAEELEPPAQSYELKLTNGNDIW